MTGTRASTIVAAQARAAELISVSDAERRAIWVVMPCFNEDGSLGAVLSDVTGFGYSIVVIDDGSRVAAASLVAGSEVHVLRHCVNLGQGAALQTGIDYALLHGARYIVTFDSDGQHRADEIARLIDALRASGADVALGTRFGEGGRAVNISRARSLTLRIATRLSRFSTGLNITDTHNGFRALTRDAAARMRITQNRMAHASQILDEIARLSLKYVEVPVTIRYTDYSLRKGQRMSNAFNILWESLAGRFS
jgi:glycosyltransferase involved in cell wall biosynthesis